MKISKSTTLGQHTITWYEHNDKDKSEFYPLSEGVDALGARLLLIDAAEQSIDLQYFLMKDDVVGAIFTAKLLDAADRGVRVRFLLDDIFTTIKDEELFILDNHQNIEVRLFNPISRRGFRNLNYLGDFKRANRRMHNKSFTVDGSFTIVGGRNIAEEYYSLKDNSVFFDFDVLAKGAIVEEVADSFDKFWNDRRAMPINNLSDSFTEELILTTQRKVDAIMEKGGADIYQAAINSMLLINLIEGHVAGFTAEAHLISETPEKLDAPLGDKSFRLIQELGEILSRAENEIIIFTPYFIPRKAGMSFLQEIIDRGVQISLLTNSLASTNHVPVHGAYMAYRQDLLAMGVDLYEARPDAFKIIQGESVPDKISTLHTKLIIIDQRFVFIGSLNLDPRSVTINTEMGIMIDSEDLAKELLEDGESMFDQVVYHLQLNQDNKIEWHGLDEGQQVVHHKDPQTSWWRRFSAKLFRILPEGQL